MNLQYVRMSDSHIVGVIGEVEPEESDVSSLMSENSEEPGGVEGKECSRWDVDNPDFTFHQARRMLLKSFERAPELKMEFVRTYFEKRILPKMKADSEARQRSSESVNQ